MGNGSQLSWKMFQIAPEMDMVSIGDDAFVGLLGQNHPLKERRKGEVEHERSRVLRLVQDGGCTDTNFQHPPWCSSPSRLAMAP